MTSCALLYLHGLGSSGQSDTGQFLQRHFAARVSLMCPDYRPQFFAESVSKIDRWINTLKAQHASVAVLGSSMGGWQGLHASLRHPEPEFLLLNPVLDPDTLRETGQREPARDNRSGVELPWPDLTADNFPAVPVPRLDAGRLRLLIGRNDDVVAPGPTLAACRQYGLAHRVFDWGHRADFGAEFKAEINALIERAEQAALH